MENNIEGWMEDYIMDFLRQSVKSCRGDALIVEVGAWKGRSTAELYLASRTGQTVVTIDTWLGQPDLIFEAHSEVLRNDIFIDFMMNMEMLGIKPRWYKKGDKGCRYLRMKSTIAATLFDDNSVDMIFLDGDHSAVDKDIDAWKPKIKSDGIFSGHDYHWPGVKDKVEARFPVRNIENLWIRK